MELKVLPVVQVTFAALAMILLDYLFPIFSYGHIDTTSTAILLVICASTIGILAIVNFRSQDTTVNPMKPDEASTVVSHGIYTFSRNPMYLALALFLLAISVYLANYISLLLIPAFIWYITEYQIKPEEQALEKLFGDDYLAYKARVRRWF